MSFYDRLRKYFEQVAEVLRGEAFAASVFPNPTDVGTSREKIYAEFLRQHAPSKCNVFLGGYLFHADGTESKQLDVIVTTDTAPRYNFHNRDGNGKSFSPVEGTLAVASIKSQLNKSELHDALDNIGSIPPTEALNGRISPLLEYKRYEDWPLKIIYATTGLSGETILGHLNEYYTQHPHIPIHRRPNLLHVSGRYVILRSRGMLVRNPETLEPQQADPDAFYMFTVDPDLVGICWTLNALQKIASASSHIIYKYDYIMDRLTGCH